MKCPFCKFEAAHLDDWSIHAHAAHSQPVKIGCDERLTIARDISAACGVPYDLGRPEIRDSVNIPHILEVLARLELASTPASALLFLGELDEIVARIWIAKGLERWYLPLMRYIRNAVVSHHGQDPNPEISVVHKMLEPYDK